MTPLAESLVQPVRDCLLQIQRTVASKTEFNPATSNRKFCLAVSEYATAVLISQALQDIAKMAPGITFELVRLDGTNEQKLEKGEIDFSSALLLMPSPCTRASRSSRILSRV